MLYVVSLVCLRSRTLVTLFKIASNFLIQPQEVSKTNLAEHELSYDYRKIIFKKNFYVNFKVEGTMIINKLFRIFLRLENQSFLENSNTISSWLQLAFHSVYGCR